MKKLLGLTLLLLGTKSFAGTSVDPQLFDELKSLDSVIFTAGFNQCETDKIVPLFTEDLEFYHDVGGLTLGRDAFIQSVENNICKNQHKPNRHLVDGSLEVHALYNNGKLYGAIQSGVHTFSDVQGGERGMRGIAKFTHVWVLDEGAWKIKRVLSFDHKPFEQ